MEITTYFYTVTITLLRNNSSLLLLQTANTVASHRSPPERLFFADTRHSGALQVSLYEIAYQFHTVLEEITAWLSAFAKLFESHVSHVENDLHNR